MKLGRWGVGRNREDLGRIGRGEKNDQNKLYEFFQKKIEISTNTWSVRNRLQCFTDL